MLHESILGVAIIKGWDVSLHFSKTSSAPCFNHELQCLIHQVRKNHPAAAYVRHNASTTSTPSSNVCGEFVKSLDTEQHSTHSLYLAVLNQALPAHDPVRA